MPAPGADGLTKVETTLTHDGQVLRIFLDAPPGNVLDAEMIHSLRRTVRATRAQTGLRLIVFAGTGKHFSFGASVEEHRPQFAEGMLTTFHGFFHELIDIDVPTLALVRGQCLGGGLELAAFCDWLWAEETARMGQPEIKLGVFAPVGSVVIPWRCGARANDLLLSGRSVDAQEGARLGLVDRVCPSGKGDEVLDFWVTEQLLPLSAASLRRARRAARWHLHRQMKVALPELETLYLEDLMKTADAAEGIEAFLANRKPEWKDS